MELDRSHLETAGIGAALLATIIGLVRWIFTPMHIQATRDVLRQELTRFEMEMRELRSAIVHIEAVSVRLEGIERRLQLLEERGAA